MYTIRTSKIMALSISTITIFSVMLIACGETKKTNPSQISSYLTASPQVESLKIESPPVESCMANLPKLQGKEISEIQLKKETGKFTVQEIHFALDINSNHVAVGAGGNYIIDIKKNTYKTSHCFNAAGKLPENYESHQLKIPLAYTFQYNDLKSMQLANLNFTPKKIYLEFDHYFETKESRETKNDISEKWHQTENNEFTRVYKNDESNNNYQQKFVLIIKYRLVPENETIKKPIPENETNGDSNSTSDDSTGSSSSTGSGSSNTTILPNPIELPISFPNPIPYPLPNPPNQSCLSKLSEVTGNLINTKNLLSHEGNFVLKGIEFAGNISSPTFYLSAGGKYEANIKNNTYTTSNCFSQTGDESQIKFDKFNIMTPQVFNSKSGNIIKTADLVVTNGNTLLEKSSSNELPNIDAFLYFLRLAVGTYNWYQQNQNTFVLEINETKSSGDIQFISKTLITYELVNSDVKN